MDHRDTAGELSLWKEQLLWLPELEAGGAPSPDWSQPLTAADTLELLLTARRGVRDVQIDQDRECLSLLLDTQCPHLTGLIGDIRAAGFSDIRTWRYPHG